MKCEHSNVTQIGQARPPTWTVDLMAPIAGIL